MSVEEMNKTMSSMVVTQSSRPSLVARFQRRMQRKSSLAWSLVMPALLVLIAVGLVPTLYVLVLAFSSYRLGASLFELEFVGLQNFTRAFTTARFWDGLQVTAAFVFLNVAIQLVLGFIIALAFDRVTFLVRRVALTFALVPMMIVPAVVGLLWRLIYNETYGPLNYILGLVGLPEPRWGSDPFTALVGLLIADIWQWTPFIVILLLAGLQSLSREVHDAAYVDGANAWQAFLYITLPLMKPFIFLAVFLRMVDAWKAFDLIATLTQGGPGNQTESIAYYTWKIGFGVSADRGFAAALSLMQLIVIIILGKLLLTQLSRVARGD